jgi:protein SCO1/2
METTHPAAESEEGRASPWMIIIFGILIAISIAAVLFSALTPHFHASVYSDPQPVADFTLKRADGGTFSLSETRGKVAVIYFGYTSCPDVCPTTLGDLRRTLEALGDQADQVQIIFITIDPATDTSERIADYLSYFHPSFVGLYGTPDELQTVMDRFGVAALGPGDGDTAPSAGLTHTTSVFVIDRAGRLRLRAHYGAAVKDIVQDLRYLIREKGS